MKKKIFLFVILFSLMINLGFANEAPPKNVEVEIPTYETYKMDGWDYADIPGGKALLVEGKPRVPYYSLSIDYPSGYRVQDVVMKEKSGMETAVGLNLSIVTNFPESSPESSSPPSEEEEWYPEEDYRWEVLMNSDGSSTLLIDIYPFHYNVNTTEVKFYRHYKFEIAYVFSSISIINIATDNIVYDLGEEVTVNVLLNNSGKAQDVVVSALMKKYGSDVIVDGLPLRTLHNVIGPSSFSISWDSRGFPAGDYYAEITLMDPSGNWLDKGNCQFKLGISMLNVTCFSVKPQHFKIGDVIQIKMGVINVGSTTTSGRCTFRILENVSIVKEFYHNISSLAPGESIEFTSNWDTSTAKKGIVYYVLGYVRYEGHTTLPITFKVSTNYFPIAKFSYSPQKVGLGEEILFDASGSNDPDGNIVSFKWDFGDGGESSSEKPTHSYYNLGYYEVSLTVTDNERATNTTSQILNVVMAYYLQVSSNIGFGVEGSGKYREDEEVALYAPSSIDMPGILGMLGGKYVFKQWVGVLNSTKNNVTLVFKGYNPKLNMQAIYVEDYSRIMFTVLIIAVVVAVAIAVAILRRRKRRQK